MNERLQNLAREAGHFEFNKWDYFDINKFAELIVKECAGIYSKIDNGNLHMGTDNYLEALQKHFGVES